MFIRRGELYFADLSPVIGSEQGGTRPVLIIQNDLGNKHSPTVIIAAITSKINKAKIPTHVEISSTVYPIEHDSVILLEQIRTIDKKRIKQKIGCLSSSDMELVDQAISISFWLTNNAYDGK